MAADASPHVGAGSRPDPAAEVSREAALAGLQADFARAAEAMWPALHARLPGVSLEVLASADSTNTRLLQRARTGDASPTALVAIEQTAGRGRQGRSWHARPGDALTFSLALPWSPDAGDRATLDGLSVAVGVALAEALHERVHVKWPNDLWRLDERGAPGKLGGVLIEVAPLARQPAGQPAQRLVVIGVGLNVRGQAPRAELAAAPQASSATPVVPPAMPYAALAALQPDEPALAQPAAVWQRVLPALVEAWLLFRREGFAPFVGRFARRDALAGRDVTLWQADGGQQAGRACGADDQGRLLVHTAAGPVPWSAGDVSVRLA